MTKTGLAAAMDAAQTGVRAARDGLFVALPHPSRSFTNAG